MNGRHWLFLLAMALVLLVMVHVTFASKRCRDWGKVPVFGTEALIVCVAG
jgi:hypothetical protein